MQCRGIRGAITVHDNTAEEIVAATKALLTRLVERNALQPENIASVFFTVTDDLDAAYPARAARELGWTDVALLCALEIDVPDGIRRCVRVLIHVNTDRAQRDMCHAYLRGAAALRPDRVESPEEGVSSHGTALGRIAILGLGLIGASVGLALRERDEAQEVYGYDADPSVTTHALDRGAITLACDTVREAVREADIVVLATPVLAIRDLLAQVNEAAPRNALITDVGSTKGLVVEWARAELTRPERFVGGHPMAGSERSGVDAARADLFAGCVWCLTPNAQTMRTALDRATNLVKALGAAPTQVDVDEHDDAMSLVSHLPLVTATALVLAVSRQQRWPMAGAFAAGGFRDTTRVASGDIRMARDICLTNREALMAQIDQLVASLSEIRGQIAAGDVEIESLFAEAKRARDTWTIQRLQRERAFTPTRQD